MVHDSIIIGIFIVGVAILFLSPDARIPRLVKALLQSLVQKPRVRLWLNLDSIAPPVSLRGLTDMVGGWTKKTFVSAGGIGACNHIKDEIEELKEVLQRILDAKNRGEAVDPADKYEMDLELADLQILIMDIAYCQGTDLTDATLLKHYINTLRKWSAPDERGVQHHIEEEVKGYVGRSPEQELFLLKQFPGMGREKLAAIVAQPDPTICAALDAVLDADAEKADKEGLSL